MRFAALSAADRKFYIETGESLDKAGAYGMQGVGNFMVQSIEGSYSNVIGLPVAEVVSAIRELSERVV